MGEEERKERREEGGWEREGKGRVGLGEKKKKGRKKDRRMEEEGSEGKTKGRFCHYREAYFKSL